ncbi:uncharacterized protein PHACADRAFT_259995 [Phanerochaete carnosa HHB-10118-sp]|uniref:Uncharacterized protein n=1 Tax=Phanerochaete carnosa (strain HHB-10118-sp) TaxID=650164 RepID=K5W3R2_PHACS|nr:uncharacterized protein PHACADRAFT_259995 [Phanerochaete carnosa HHB-10118-sp]EKM53569.1 hypothetical protein PHACADRAFT_259995 [Phanerochaete carnosa HHB-10118-sp]
MKSKDSAQDLVDICTQRGATDLGFSRIINKDGQDIDERPALPSRTAARDQGHSAVLSNG